MINKADLAQLVTLRHSLHQNAELSNNEFVTAQIIKAYIHQFNPDKVYEEVGGHGLIFRFKGTASKPLKIGFRADMDALPIDETVSLKYGSINAGIAHKCGHDGHSVMVAGIAQLLRTGKQVEHDVYLIFQPAEETGHGAEAVTKFLEKRKIKLDYLFGLHNLPGFKKGQIACRKGSFAAASTGMLIELKGHTSHAAEPEKGNSPALAFASIIKGLSALTTQEKFEKLVLTTVVQANLGEIAFGTTPAHAEIRVTLRAIKDADLLRLKELAEALVLKEAAVHKLDYELSYTESFPSTENTQEMFDLLKDIAGEMNFNFQKIDKPFKWSEDFGHFKNVTQSGFFGLGAGKSCAVLHHETYDFPDNIIEDGLKMYMGILAYFENNDGK